MKMSILQYPNELLYVPSQPVSQTNGLYAIVKNMQETVVSANGLAISAIQVGIPLQIFVWNPTHFSHLEQDFGPFLTCINPYIEYHPSDPTEYGDETCLSISKRVVRVNRYTRIAMAYQCLTGDGHLVGMGKEFTLPLLARVVQHEYDHMKGILITQYDKRYEAV